MPILQKYLLQLTYTYTGLARVILLYLPKVIGHGKHGNPLKLFAYHSNAGFTPGREGMKQEK